MRELIMSECDTVAGGLDFTVGGYTVSMGNNGLGGSVACTMFSQGIAMTAGIMSMNFGVYRYTGLGVNLVCNFATGQVTITNLGQTVITSSKIDNFSQSDTAALIQAAELAQAQSMATHTTKGVIH